MSRKRVLILFPNEHLPFSPTTLGLHDFLAEHCDVTIYAPQPRVFRKEDLGRRDVRYFPYRVDRASQVRALPGWLWQRATRGPLSSLSRGEFTRFLALRAGLRSVQGTYDEVIAVDPLFLYAAVTSGRSAHLLSLELSDPEIAVMRRLDPARIRSVVVQSEERYRYLFPGGEVRHFLVQNAPVFSGPHEVTPVPDSIMFNGTAVPWFGLDVCLRFLREHPRFRMTIKGAVLQRERERLDRDHADLLREGRLVIHAEYVSAEKMLEFLRPFQAGVCFYDTSYPFINTFNYLSAPSGKMFSYFAAGVPVIANRLPGLEIVEEFEAGVVIDDFEPATILAAMEKVQAHHARFRSNCFRAAAHFSFDRMVAPFVEFLAHG